MHVIDLLPTFLELAGAPKPAGLPLPGRSLLPMLRGEAAGDRALFFEHEGNRAVHEGRWKLVALRGRDWELYDREKDPVELNNLAAQHPDIVAKLGRQWDQWAAANHVTPLPKDYQVEYLGARGGEKGD